MLKTLTLADRKTKLAADELDIEIDKLRARRANIKRRYKYGAASSSGRSKRQPPAISEGW